MAGLLNRGVWLVLLLAVPLLWADLVRAQPEGDPFSKANEIKLPVKEGPGIKIPGPAKPAREPATAKYISFDVSVNPTEARRGDLVTLTIKGKLQPGWHTYPITQRADNPNQDTGQLSRLIYGDNPGIIPLWPIRESPSPEWEILPEQGAFLEYKEPFTWSQDFLVQTDAQPGPATLTFRIKVQVCQKSCIWGEHAFEIPLRISSAPANKPGDVLGRRQPPGIAVIPVPASGPAAAQKAETNLLGLILISMGAAVAMLFTPCVFPMIPITVSFFLKQSEKEHHKPLATAGVYSLTITVVLALAVLVLGTTIVELANSWWLNLGLGLVLIFFALSLFGMYEIELPSGLARFTSAREGQGGYAGAFFMALTFTITSFTCTGPFLGPLLVAAKELQLSMDQLLFASLAYSATFAAPFFVMALFPTLLKGLPRSGGWLNNVKVVMGFLELAAALKFLANTDLAFNPGNGWFFNFETVIGSWIVLSFACGLYLLGLFRLPHDSPVEFLSVPRLVLATIFLGLALYLIPALFHKQPMGKIGEWALAFAPPDTSELPGGTSQGSNEGKLEWTFDYQKARNQALREGKLVFIDFTGVNCTNCRANERNVFTRKEVRQELEKFALVQLYNDSVPDRSLSGAEAKAQADRNEEWQRQTFGDVSTPLYVIFQPDKDEPFEGNKLKGKELGRFPGYISDVQKFVAFLKDPQRK